MKLNSCAFCKRKAKHQGKFYFRGYRSAGTKPYLLDLCDIHANKIRNKPSINLITTNKLLLFAEVILFIMLIT